ncbi:MAG: helicase C-terminal domain-containing protein [Opitutaceae bacterium]|nr:helicase C-terminal domain-containing protein [Opitutaceae bacterium]
MQIDLDARLVRLSAGEFSEFFLGPSSSEGTPSGLWRAQLGTQWHRTLRSQVEDTTPGAFFEVPLAGELVRRGWRIAITGRIDQWLPGDPACLREVKTTTRELPIGEEELRALYSAYFHQLGIYLALLSTGDLQRPDGRTAGEVRAELYFIEVSSGLAQVVPFTHDDERRCEAQLERLCTFLDARLRSRERLRSLALRPAFTNWRPGQETTSADLLASWSRRPIVFFEAPTGFGKTGVMLEAALARMRQGDADRLIYLTSKTTGQLQVMTTLGRMTATTDGGEASLSLWRMRPRQEHCVNTLYRCTPEACLYLNGIEERWPESGLSRFFLVPGHARDLPALREAGKAARICPYEITRAALPFCEVWIGDFNYLFSPSVAPVFLEQPGFDPGRTLVVIDEAHNLPSRAADARSHVFSSPDTSAVVSLLQGQRAPGPLTQAWDAWSWRLSCIKRTDTFSLAYEEDLSDQLRDLAQRTQEYPVDTAAWPAPLLEAYWAPARFAAESKEASFPRLWWAPEEGRLLATCLDAAAAIGPTLRGFAGVLLASATLGPTEDFRRACGLEATPGYDEAPPASAEPARPERLGKLSKRATTALLKQLHTGASLLRESDEQERLAPAYVQAHAPWRAEAYRVAIDVRVDTRYQQREAFAPDTAETVCALVSAAPDAFPCVPAFFPSFAYAERIAALCSRTNIRIALQPRSADTAALERWLDICLAQRVALLLVLGSSLAESVDLLGGRTSHAMVVGPALPEVNAVQRAKLALRPGETKEQAFRRVYQVPGMQRVNQALGRLVRAPGQTAHVLLHCRRFADPSYLTLLEPEYQHAQTIAETSELGTWLTSTHLRDND